MFHVKINEYAYCGQIHIMMDPSSALMNTDRPLGPSMTIAIFRYIYAKHPFK